MIIFAEGQCEDGASFGTSVDGSGYDKYLHLVCKNSLQQSGIAASPRKISVTWKGSKTQ